ncbi:MAG: PspC domain-containing protein [Rubrobacteraceae bacterium]|nr:PspC domain-containing protein [Rubrobacter sp.]
MDIKRTKRDRLILGVCGGLALHFGWSSNVVRLLAVLGTLFLPGPGWLIPVGYLVLGAVLPESEVY